MDIFALENTEHRLSANALDLVLGEYKISIAKLPQDDFLIYAQIKLEINRSNNFRVRCSRHLGLWVYGGAKTIISLNTSFSDINSTQYGLRQCQNSTTPTFLYIFIGFFIGPTSRIRHGC